SISDMGAEALKVAGKLEETSVDVTVDGETFTGQDVLTLNGEVYAVKVEDKYYRLSDLEVEVDTTDPSNPSYSLKAKDDAQALEVKEGDTVAIDISTQES